jgi:hypothetical protein
MPLLNGRLVSLRLLYMEAMKLCALSLLRAVSVCVELVRAAYWAFVRIKDNVEESRSSAQMECLKSRGFSSP